MTEEQQQSLVHFLDKAESRFDNAPAGMLFEQEKSYAVQLFDGNDFLKKTAEQSPMSLLSAMSNVASIGLSLNPAKKQAYLVPRGGKICLDPSYMGMCDLAIQSGTLEFVQAKVVYESDDYTNRGIDKEPEHTYSPFRERGAVLGVYCVAKTAKGDYLTTEMEKEKVDDVKNRSEMGKKNKGPWFTDYNEMAKKTVIRNAFKMWPKTPTMERLALAVDLSNQNEGFEPIISNPDFMQHNEEQKKHYNYLIEQNDAIGMYLFTKSIPEISTSLYNSFEVGTKGKCQDAVNKLLADGRGQLVDCQLAVEDSASQGDDLGVKEIIEDLPEEAVEFICENTDDETRQFIQECKGNE